MLNKPITISVDDGHPLDFKSADLLFKYGHQATFYWSKTNPKHEVMDEEMMLTFVKKYPSMDVQNHTYSHPLLTKLSGDDLETELQLAYAWHTDILGEPTGLCVPRGYVSHQVAACAARVGFEYIRTVRPEKSHTGQIKALDGGYHFYQGKMVKRGTTPGLWWHSWEVEKDNAWDALEEILSELTPTMTNTEYVRFYL